MADPIGQRHFRRILIIKPSSIGDVIHALPMAEAVRRHWRDAHLAWLATPVCAEVLDSVPWIDEVIPFDRKDYGGIATRWGSAKRFFRFLSHLRGSRFDFVIDAQGLFRSAFIAWATGAPTRLGFDRAREFARTFYTHCGPQDMNLHAVDRMIELIRSTGTPVVGRRFDVNVDVQSQKAADSLLSSVGVLPNQRFVAIAPAARWETKCWPWSRYSRLADMLSENAGLNSVVMGAPDEHEVCQRVCDSASSNPANLCGKTDLRATAAILNRASVVVCNDSGGSMHLASALGRPLAAVFGPTNYRRTGPYGRADAVISANLPCSPCYLREVSQCPHDHRCMTDVSEAQVLEKALFELSRPKNADTCSLSSGA
jgi:lipopolysaccharide heptosyltransferase I